MSEGFVYAIECGGRIKLGFSTQPVLRLNKITADVPFPCTLLGYWPGSEVDEKSLHAQFSDLRRHGEWFQADPSILSLVSAKKIPAPSRRKRFDVQPSDGPLTKWRKTNRLTLDDLAQRLGMHRLSIWRWEAGYSRVAIDKLAKVSAVTGIPREELRPDIFGEAAQ